MKIGILKKAKRQRGAALILVLISVAAGSLLVIPTLNYVYTGLQETRIADRLLLEQYSADAAIEYGLWQLENNVDNITDEFALDYPEAFLAKKCCRGLPGYITTGLDQIREQSVHTTLCLCL